MFTPNSALHKPHVMFVFALTASVGHDGDGMCCGGGGEEQALDPASVRRCRQSDQEFAPRRWALVTAALQHASKSHLITSISEWRCPNRQLSRTARCSRATSLSGSDLARFTRLNPITVLALNNTPSPISLQPNAPEHSFSYLILNKKLGSAPLIFQILSLYFPSGPFQPSNDMMLKFYSYYKQATVGVCNIPRPGFWDAVGKAKW